MRLRTAFRLLAATAVGTAMLALPAQADDTTTTFTLSRRCWRSPRAPV